MIEVDYVNGVCADFAAIVPGATRVGDRGVRFEAPDPVSRPTADFWPASGSP